MASSAAQWPLLTQVLAEIDSADSLVRWGRDAWGNRRVVGLRELRVAVLLLACSRDEADERPEAHKLRGLLNCRFEEECPRHSASFLDLALRFGHADFARHLSDVGVEQRKLNVEDLQCLPTPSLVGLPLWRCMQHKGNFLKHEVINFDKLHWSKDYFWWAWKEEALSRWYSAVERQRWASDWDAPVPLARMLVDVPATRAVLTLASEGVHVGASEDAELRLLDAALLLGVPGAVAGLADRCGRQSLKRAWGALYCDTSSMAVDYIEAFLRAGHYGVVAVELSGYPSEEPTKVALRWAARLAVRTGSLSLAQAVRSASGVAPAQLEHRLRGIDVLDLTEDDSVAHAGRQEWEVRRAELEVLEALGSLGAGCTAEVLMKGKCAVVPTLFLAVLLGDESAARRLVRAGHSFLRLGLDSVGFLAADALELDSRDGIDMVGLPAGRLETAEGTLGLIFAAAARHCLAALVATSRCGFLQLLEHVAGFGAMWSEGDERVRQELRRLTGRDPLASCNPWQAVASARAGAERPPSEACAEARGGTFNEGPAGDQHAASAGEPQGPPQEEPAARSSAETPCTAGGAEGAASEQDGAPENEKLSRALRESELEAAQALSYVRA